MTTMNSKYSSIVDTSSDDSDSDSGDDAPQAVSAKDAANSEKQRQAKDEQRRAAQRKVRKATSQKQANRPRKAASVATTPKPEDSSDSVPSASSAHRPSSTASSSKLDPALFEQADEAFRAVKEAAIRAAAEEQARQSTAGAGGATGNPAKSAGSSDKGKKRKLDEADYAAAIQKAEKAKTRTVGDVTVQQIDSTSPSTSSAKSSVPKHASVDVSSAVPASKTRAFLQDRLFKRRRSNTVAGPSSRKKRGKQAEKPHLIFDPLLDKKPVKKEKTRTEKKEALRERMRGRQGAVTAFTRGNSQTMAAGFGFKRQ